MVNRPFAKNPAVQREQGCGGGGGGADFPCALAHFRYITRQGDALARDERWDFRGCSFADLYFANVSDISYVL